MPTKKVPQHVDWERLGFVESRFIVRIDKAEGKRVLTHITAFDAFGHALPYLRKTARRKPPFFVIVDGITVAMDEDHLIWYCKSRVDLRKYGYIRLDEHTREA